ncbi:MAG: transposase family protein [Marmoricola sp.]|nr:transposase family protein [Marmoricola sp.]
MQNATLWRALLGVEKTVVEDIEFDEDEQLQLPAALPQLVTDRETKLIVVGGPSDRTAIADAALRSRKRNLQRAYQSARVRAAS